MAAQRELANIQELRRQDGIPSLTGRQILYFGLRTFYRTNVDFETAAAQDSMVALRDAVKKSPPSHAQFQKLLQAVDDNMALPSAYSMPEADKLKHLEDSCLTSGTNGNSTWSPIVLTGPFIL